jgi:cell division septation protein DedD
MTNKALVGVALGVGLAVFLTAFYLFYPSGEALRVEPDRPAAPGEVEPRTAPEFAEKPVLPEPGEPPVQDTPVSGTIEEATPPEEAPPSLEPPEPEEVLLPPAEPQEQYGLLVRRYRTHEEASRVMEKLQEQGTPAFVRHDGQHRRPYALWAGPFPNQEEAKAAARAIRARFKFSAKPEKLQLPIPK